MIQNIPHGQSGDSDTERRNEGSVNHNGEPGDVASNPYYARHQAAPPPDLDAAAPTLKSSEIQRLNRKALVFLAGIVGALVVAVILMLRNATRGDEQVRQAREETVVIPELPRTEAISEPAQPVAVVAAEPSLPPLPSGPERLQPAYPPPMGEYPEQPRGQSLIERRIVQENVNSSEANDPYTQAVLASLQAQQGKGVEQSTAAAASEATTNARFIQKPNTLLARGTYIRCILETRIVTDVSGFTSCVVTEPVYSINGRNLLLPKGSKILGSYASGLGGVPRVSVVWDRITTPNGMDIAMSSPGVDTLGGAGYTGRYDAHWGSKISSALLISLIGDAFKYVAAEHGPEATTVTGSGLAVRSPYQSATARTMERLASQTLDRNMNRPPTVTINQGTLVNVYVAKDVDFSAVVAQR
jgi:type IV secretion system protein VirB10